MTAALHAELPQIPERLRKATLALQASQQRQLDQFGAAGVCLLIESRYSVGGVCGTSAAELARQGMLTNLGVLAGLVPDGVATVTATYPASHTTSAVSVTARVVNNVFVTDLDITHRGRTQPTLTWRSGDGSLIKRIAGARRSTNPGFCAGRAASPPGVRPCE